MAREDLKADLFGGTTASWVVAVDQVPVLVARAEVAHAFDGTATARLLPLTDIQSDEVEGLLAGAVVEDLARRLGARKLHLRFCPSATDGGDLFQRLHGRFPVEGVLPHYWSFPDQRLDDAILTWSSRPGRPTAFALGEALFGTPPAGQTIWDEWTGQQFAIQREGRRSRLRPLQERDVPSLYGVETRDGLDGWHFRSIRPAQANFVAHLHDGVLLQYVVEVDDGRVGGRVFLYNAPDDMRHARIGMVLEPELWGSGWPMESLIHFVSECFNRFPLRCIYFDTASSAQRGAVQSLARLLPLVAHHPDQRLGASGTHDAYTFCLSRELAAVVGFRMAPAFGA